MDSKNNLSVPMAIMGAGLIIAIMIFVTFHKSSPAPIQNVNSATSNINLKPVSSSDHILGSADAPIIIVEFSDLECPFCKEFESTMNSLMDTYGKDGKLAWVYRHFPLNIHPKYSEKESEASECASELGGALITAESNDALAAGAGGTPYNVMVLKNALNATAESNIRNYVSSNALSQNVTISSDKKEIVLNGAIPAQFIQPIIDFVLAK